MPRSPVWRYHAWGTPGSEIIPTDFVEIWLALWAALGVMDD
jgi:hypothetical protein